MTTSSEITSFLMRQFADIKVSDFSNNGVQCEGAETVSKAGFAVDACVATFEEASRRGCRYLFCHHGISWGGGIARVTNYNYHRLKTLMDGEMTLFAMHLPLDAHPDLGNNAVLSEMLGIPRGERQPFGVFQGSTIGFSGMLPKPLALQDVAGLLDDRLDTQCRIFDFRNAAPIRKVGIVSGGGAGCIDEAARNGIDCLITGEMPHQYYHYAREQGLDVIAGGHYATETTGPRAVMAAVQRQFPELLCEFIDIPTGL